MKSISVEEQVRAIILQKVSTASPVKNFRIDKTQVFIKRLGDDKNHAALLALENTNQTLEFHNGVLRKSPPQVVTSYNRSTTSNPDQQPKTSTPHIEGSFKLTSSEPPQTTNSPPKLQTNSHKQTSSHEYQITKKSSRNEASSKPELFLHSPALNAFLTQRPKIEKVTSVKDLVDPTEHVLNYGDTDLITLLPYVFQNEEEPWKPILPENFTRYPERRPFATEDYNAEGVGVVEVVLDPEDLSSSVPSKHVNSNTFTSVKPYEYLNLQHPTLDPNYEIFGPRSEEKITFVLNTEVEKREGVSDVHSKVHGDIITKHNSNLEKEDSQLADILPEIPIIQQFHNLDALFRANSLQSSSSTTDVPVTLLPAKSNLNMRRRIRPRPTKKPEREYHTASIQSDNDDGTEKNTHKFLNNALVLNLSPSQTEATDNNFNIESQRSYSFTVDEVTNNPEKSASEIKTEQVVEFPKQSPLLEKSPSIVDPPETETTTDLDGEHYVRISRTEDDVTDSINLDHYKKFEELVELSSAPLISSRNHRQLKATNSFYNDSPLKFYLQEKQEHDDSAISARAIRDHQTSTEAATNPFFFVKLKDAKMQELLERIIFNLTAEMTKAPVVEHNNNSTFMSSFNKSNTEEAEIGIAQNRKYDSNTYDSKNGLSKNSSLFHTKQDMILYYVKPPKNESSEDTKEESKTSTFTENKQIDGATKSSPNYVLNKEGFLMLTKVYNKAPTSSVPNRDATGKTNITGIAECVGNMSTKCGSGECISTLARCNNLVDCVDGSDEKNCTCAEFLRAQYLTRKICDGVVDCWDFSDENNCEWCSSGQYVCSSSRMCIDRDQVCNGEVDCPNADDERNCVSIAPNASQTDTMKYYSSGTLMIRKDGQWGKLCTQNFDILSSIFKSRWTLEDLGKVVCKTMTYKYFQSIEHVNDTNDDQQKQDIFYELLYSKEAVHHKNSRLGLTFGNTNCTERQVVRITCSSLECGVRPQANPQWGRTKRLSGSRHSRIVGGGNAGPGSWPWLAALYKEGEFQCGATLISDRWLLSAGHCFYHSLDDYWVARLGALRRGTNLPSPYEQLRVVSRILLHPNYIDSGFINDISLLQMEKPVTLTNYVRPICLPQPSAILRDGKMCTVIGWGQLFEIGRIFPDTLQEVQLPVISTAECRKRTLFLPLYKVTENMFCAGYDRGGRDACLGDSGGPLMCQQSDGHWSLMGVTSNGYGCARANRPGVYTKVANYVTWVHSSIASDETGVDYPRRRNMTCHGHRCPLGECLPPARVCNGFMECSDGSDEKDCW